MGLTTYLARLASLPPRRLAALLVVASGFAVAVGIGAYLGPGAFLIVVGLAGALVGFDELRR